MCVRVCTAVQVSYPPSRLVVVKIHQQPRALICAFGVALLPLARVHKLLGEPVAVVEVVSAAAPQPVSGQVFGSRGTAAPAARKLPLSAGAAHRVHHPGGADGVSERRFPAPCGHTNTGVTSRLTQSKTKQTGTRPSERRPVI